MRGGKPEKYRAVADAILLDAKANSVKDGDRLPSEREMAAQFGCNHLTVRRALQLLEQNNQLYRIASRGSFWGPRPEQLRKTGLIGFVFPDDEIFYYSLFARFERILIARNFHAIVHLSNRLPVKEDDILEYFLNLNLTALITVPNEKCRGVYSRLNVPTLFFDLNIPELSIPYVISNGYAGSFACTEHLLSLGHRKIALLKHQTDNIPSRDQGFFDALSRHGVTPCRKYIRRDVPSRAWGYRMAKELLELPDPPTALLCHNDTVAAGAMRYCHENGISVPDDLSIVGWGDTAIAEDLNLTSVNPSQDRIVEALAHNLLALLDGRPVREATVLPTRLIVRGSSGKVPRDEKRVGRSADRA